MTRYVAFLRGINVSGQKLIKMETLSGLFAGMGFSNIKTLIQSGNVIFDSSGKNAAKLKVEIEKNLTKSLGYDVTVILKTVADIEKIVKQDPFGKIKADPGAKHYVSFLEEEPGSIPALPYFSPKKDVEIFHAEGDVMFCLSHAVKGSYGFPNGFIEKEFKIAATTRNWNTIVRITK